MKVLRQLVMWGTAAAIALLAILSILGAFLGDERAKAVFNSPPLILFWILFVALLLLGFVGYRGLLRRPGPLLMHFGSLLIIVGSMWASDLRHDLPGKLAALVGPKRPQPPADTGSWGGGQGPEEEAVPMSSGLFKVPSGVMVIEEGQTSDCLRDAGTRQPLGRLPFGLRLNRFWIEYYPKEKRPWPLSVVTLRHRAGMERKHLGWKAGQEFVLPDTDIRVKILQYLAGARPVKDAQGRVVSAEPAPEADRPAMEVLIRTEGREERAWLVPEENAPEAERPLRLPTPTMDDMRRGTFVMAQSLFLSEPKPVIRAYKSDLSVIRDGRQVARKTIAVNQPLHYGGYHFYQYSWEDEGGTPATVLLARSDSGLYVVYAGFFGIVLGTFWWLWGVPAWRFLFGRS